MRTKAKLLHNILFLIMQYEDEMVWQLQHGNEPEFNAAKAGRNRMLRHLAKYISGMEVQIVIRN